MISGRNMNPIHQYLAKRAFAHMASDEKSKKIATYLKENNISLSSIKGTRVHSRHTVSSNVILSQHLKQLLSLFGIVNSDTNIYNMYQTVVRLNDQISKCINDMEKLQTLQQQPSMTESVTLSGMASNKETHPTELLLSHTNNNTTVSGEEPTTNVQSTTSEGSLDANESLASDTEPKQQLDDTDLEETIRDIEDIFKNKNKVVHVNFEEITPECNNTNQLKTYKNRKYFKCKVYVGAFEITPLDWESMKNQETGRLQTSSYPQLINKYFFENIKNVKGVHCK